MARVTVTFSISIPPQLAEEIEGMLKKEHRTRSELIREALRQYARIGRRDLHSDNLDSKAFPHVLPIVPINSHELESVRINPV
jgi:metal-responsive CopG/Arc/MetJ family transcriptional regulator